MEKENSRYVIGIDGGGTKTIAALADFGGKILVKSKSGPSNPRNIGIKRAILNITEAIILLLKENKKRKIFSTTIALPAIEEEYKGKKREILRLLRVQKKISKIFQGKVEIVSDQIAAFKAGTDEKEGIVLISGTGSVSHGWRKNKEAKASGWGWLTGEGSAFWVGQKVFQAILKDLDKRGPKTLLTKLVFKKFKIKKITDFLKKIYSRNPTMIIPQFSIICDKASQRGDRMAKKIMVEAAKEVALDAKTVIYELNFQKEKFPLVLIGSMFKTKIFLDEVKKEIKKIAPQAQFIHLRKEPVIGAVKLAIEQMRK